MAQRVILHCGNTGLLQILFESVLHLPGFNNDSLAARKQERIWVLPIGNLT